MKILHTADLHLGTPFAGRPPEQAEFLRQELQKVPEKLARLCREQECDLMLLAGDLFDAEPDMDSLTLLQSALEDAGVPVFISPGNHDPFASHSVYAREKWPGNVYIFTRPKMEAVTVEELDCRVYGAGYRSMDCRGLLEGFIASGEEKYHVAVLHGDPTNAASPCCPITRQQVQDSGLHYLALGHIHKGGSFTAGETLCAWPGCPMGRGFDDAAPNGALVVTLEEQAQSQFIPLGTPGFYDLEVSPSALSKVLPAGESRDFYRVTLTGQAPKPDLEALARQYHWLPHLQLRDHTTAETELWQGVGADTLEGVYFRILRDALDRADPQTQATITLAAKISRQILDGQEVVLP